MIEQRLRGFRPRTISSGSVPISKSGHYRREVLLSKAKEEADALGRRRVVPGRIAVVVWLRRHVVVRLRRVIVVGLRRVNDTGSAVAAIVVIAMLIAAATSVIAVVVGGASPARPRSCRSRGQTPKPPQSWRFWSAIQFSV